MTWDYSVERQKWKKLLSTETEIETTKEDFTKKKMFSYLCTNGNISEGLIQRC